MHSLRIALIAHRFEQHDGQGRVNYEIAKRAAACGHRLTLLTAHCAPELGALPNITVVPLGSEKLPSQLLRDLAFACASSAWLRGRRRDFDIVQANGYTTWAKCDLVTTHFSHTAWGRSTHFPFSKSLHPYALYQRFFTFVNSGIERLVFHRASRIIAVSDMVRDEVLRLGVPASNLQVIYNGVDVTEYHPGDAERESFYLPLDVPMALFVGDIRTSRKNLDTVLFALRQVPRLHLAVAGDTQGSAFPAMASRLGVQKRVHFLGKVTNMPTLMRAVDLFVFPSRYEAHPLVVLEAMASGLPSVLALTVGSVSSFRECFAVLEDPEDAEGLASLLQMLLDDPEKRAKLGEAARSRAMELTWDRTVEQYLATYLNVFDSRPRPAGRESFALEAGR